MPRVKAGATAARNAISSGENDASSSLRETDAAASALLAPLRELGPEMDTFTRIPAPGLVAVHMDPPEPSPAFSTHAMLSALPAEAALALTFVDGGGMDRRAGFGDSAVRLAELKRAFDPVDMFAAGHPVA